MSTKLLPLLLGILLLPSAAFATVSIQGTVIATTSVYKGGTYPYRWYVATRHDNGNLYYYWKSQNRATVIASGSGWYTSGFSLNAINKFDAEAQSTIINNLIGVDTDGDGQNDYKELAFGSDYNDADSVPSTPVWVNADTGSIYYFNTNKNVIEKALDGTVTEYTDFATQAPLELKQSMINTNLDGDAYNDYVELMYGSDPLDATNSPGVPVWWDENGTLAYISGDGDSITYMSNAGLISTTSNMTNVAENLQNYMDTVDTDNDGESDWLELKWGSNPLDNTSTTTNSGFYGAVNGAGYSATRNPKDSTPSGNTFGLSQDLYDSLTAAGYSTDDIASLAKEYDFAVDDTGGNDPGTGDDDDDTGDDDTGDDDDDNDDDSEPSTTDEILQEINDKLGDADDYPETELDITDDLNEMSADIDSAMESAEQTIKDNDEQNTNDGNTEAMDEIQNMLDDANAGDSTNLLEQSKDAIKSVFMVDVDRAKNGTFENYFQIKLPSKVYPHSLTFEWTYYQIPFDPEEWQLSKAKTIICNVRDWIYVTMSALLFIYWSKAMMALTQKTVD